MNLIHRYLLSEAIPNFISTLIVFCALIVVSQLVRLSEVLFAFGLTLENILLPFLYIIVPFLPVIIPIATAFAMMISFSRLSSDGEFTAITAAGMALSRLAVPIFIFALVITGLTILCAANLEAWGRREFVQFIYRKTQTEVDNMIRYKIQGGVFVPEFLGYVFYTEKVSKDRTEFKNVMLSSGIDDLDNDFSMFAPRAQITGAISSGDLRMTFYDGISYAHKDGPETSVLFFSKAQVDLLRVFQEKILGEDTATDDYRSYPFFKLWSYLDTLEDSDDDKLLAKAQYLFWSRFANPLAVIALCIFGMLLGIHEQRHGRNLGYLGTISVIIGTFVLIVVFRWLAENLVIPVKIAVLLPPLVLNGLAFTLFFRRNRLPPSESVWQWS